MVDINEIRKKEIAENLKKRGLDPEMLHELTAFYCEILAMAGRVHTLIDYPFIKSSLKMRLRSLESSIRMAVNETLGNLKLKPSDFQNLSKEELEARINPDEFYKEKTYEENVNQRIANFMLDVNDVSVYIDPAHYGEFLECIKSFRDNQPKPGEYNPVVMTKDQKRIFKQTLKYYKPESHE